MRNKQGFTLIEIIAVITLLAIISLLAFASVTRVIKDSQDKSTTTFDDNVIRAASVYVETNISSFSTLNTVGNSIVIYASTLVDKDYLDSDIDNPTSCDLVNTIITVVKQTDGTLSYTVGCLDD